MGFRLKGEEILIGKNAGGGGPCPSWKSRNHVTLLADSVLSIVNTNASVLYEHYYNYDHEY